MSWTLTASGHTASAAEERTFIDGITETLSTEGAGTYSATLHTQYHGLVEYTPAVKSEDSDAA